MQKYTPHAIYVNFLTPVTGTQYTQLKIAGNTCSTPSIFRSFFPNHHDDDNDVGKQKSCSVKDSVYCL